MTRLLRLGAFDVALEGCSEPQISLLEGLFRTRTRPVAATQTVDLRVAVGVGDGGPGFGSDDALATWEENGRLHFASDVVAGHLDRASVPSCLCLWIDDGNPRVRFLDHYLRIVLNFVLRRFKRLRLHAAAVNFADSTSLFVGEKGVGKTTICLHLALAGGTVLGEDQIMVRETSAGSYLVAGGDGMMRLTAQTEAHFFPRSLPEPPVILAGVPKKEIQAGDHIACQPNTEHPPQRLFFPEMGQSFAIRTLARREALSRLTAPLLPINRFPGDEDRREFLGFLVGLTRQTECLSLSLTPDLSELERLSESLE